MHRTIRSVLKGVIGPEDKTRVECPNCGKCIPLIVEEKCECPKCGGELHVSIVTLYD